MKHLGFTGTRGEMHPAQTLMVGHLLRYHRSIGFDVFHHGDCVGADAYAARMAFDLGYCVVSHPPIIKTYRAFTTCHVLCDPLPYHARNDAIVAAADAAIGVPNSAIPYSGSGTWSTITKLFHANVPYWVVAPNGSWVVTPTPPQQAEIPA